MRCEINEMEHLPPVTKPYKPIFIPFIADSEYDGLDFVGYPSRRGLDIDRLLQGDFQSLSPDQIAAFLQTWLYFGLMHEILGMNMKTEDFTRTDESGKKWLTTKNLHTVLVALRHLVDKERPLPEYTAEYVNARNSRIHKCLRLSQEVWESMSALSTSNPMSLEVALGIQVLAITLQVGATEICGGASGEPTYRKVSWERGRHWRITRNQFVEDRMIDHGWCPTVVRQIWSHGNVIGQYYSSLLGPPHRKLDHSICSPLTKDCEAMRRLPLGGVKHETEDCGCDILLVDAAKLEQIIQIDEIPVLRLIEENGIPSLEVLSSASEPGLEYTAMSHVWSDGWGNPNENSLPLCRVQKIARTILASYSIPDFDVESEEGKFYRAVKHDDRVFFWMDTLCIPREPAHIHNRAIMQMRDIYKQAERVLVYDSDLMAATHDASYEELNMRISCSRWIRRLWTVQEAVLAKRLIYQFAERPHMFMTGSLLWHARQKDLSLNYYNTVGWDCTTSFEAFDSFEGLDLLNFVWKILLTHRSVSVESDEAICGGILLNVDMKQLMGAPESERTKTLWTLLGDHVPNAILFIACSRLQDRGFSWAPASFLDCEKSGPGMYDYGSITKEGLRTKTAPYSAFEVSAPQSPTNALFPCTLHGRKYFIKTSPVTTSPSWEGLNLHHRDHMAIILEVPTVQGSDMMWSVDGSRGALVSIERRTDGILVAEYLRSVSVIQEGSSYHKFRISEWTPQEVDGTAKAPSDAKWIEVEQEWCFV